MNLRLHPNERTALLVVVLSLVVNDIVELELVNTPGGRNHAKPVTELLLLKELLGPVDNISFVAPR